MSAVFWTERRNGKSTTVRVDYATGECAKAKLEYARKREIVSLSNGICGGRAALAEAKEMDRRLGVSDKIEYRPMGNGAYAAVFANPKDKNAWMRANRRVDFNAGYGDPCPGDFRNKYPQEYPR